MSGARSLSNAPSAKQTSSMNDLAEARARPPTARSQSTRAQATHSQSTRAQSAGSTSNGVASAQSGPAVETSALMLASRLNFASLTTSQPAKRHSDSALANRLREAVVKSFRDDVLAHVGKRLNAPTLPAPPPTAPGLQDEADALYADVTHAERDVSNEAWLPAALARLSSFGHARRGELGVLTSVARRLGLEWCEDQLDFFHVTQAMARLLTLMRASEPTADQTLLAQGRPRLVLIATPPHETHTFATHVLEELFRGRGWWTQTLFGATETDLATAAQSRALDVVCLSWSSECLREDFDRCLAALTKRAPNERPLLLAGGHAAERQQARLLAAGVDRVTTSFDAALAAADERAPAARPAST
ncbi:MAG: hypothetical protein AAGF19_00515 [Pseudomonadota bacterium]